MGAGVTEDTESEGTKGTGRRESGAGEGESPQRGAIFLANVKGTYGANFEEAKVLKSGREWKWLGMGCGNPHLILELGTVFVNLTALTSLHL